jgi:L-threonylcarbamoyladenylate synthase
LCASPPEARIDRETRIDPKARIDPEVRTVPKVRIDQSSPLSGDGVAAAVAALRAGRLVILPTETVYGLAADGRDPDAVARIYEAKGRPRFNPLIAHVANLAAADALARFDDRARTLAEALWPGPLTLVAPARADCAVCDLARAGLQSVAVRAPRHPLALEVLKAFGAPIVAPSANRSGRPSPTNLDDAISETGATAAAALDGGACAVGLESTVVGLMPDEPARLLRPGGVTRAEIEAVIGPLAAAADDGHRSPGRLAAHYAPDAPVRLNANAPLAGEVYLAFGPNAIEGENVLNLSPRGDVREAAANLFGYLRRADRQKPIAIAVSSIPDVGIGEAINDRLARAAGRVG